MLISIFLQTWISNEKAKHKPTTPKNPTTPQTRIPTVKRALSGYNVFMKEFFHETKVDGNWSCLIVYLFLDLQPLISIVPDYLKEHTDIIIEGLEGLKKINRIAGHAWSNLSASEKHYYRERADQLAQKIKDGT